MKKTKLENPLPYLEKEETLQYKKQKQEDTYWTLPYTQNQIILLIGTTRSYVITWNAGHLVT